MKFMIFIGTDSCVAQVREAPGALQAWIKEGEERGIRVDGQRLRPPTHAKLLRIREGELTVSDGPFCESKEWIAGYDILDCKDLDEAIDFASRHPVARAGQIEIRPYWPL